MKVLKFWVLTPETAEKFFETSLYKEAVTEKEKQEILDDMEKDGEVITSGTTADTKEEFAKKLSEYANVMIIKKDKK